jgi:cytochrome P450 family 135
VSGLDEPRLGLPPGPRVPRVLQAVLWGLRYPEFTRAARARYGPTFTVRPGTCPATVVTTDRDAIRRLLTGAPLDKRHGNDVLKPLIGERSILLLEPAEHLERRKLLLPPFHGERVRAYAQLMRRLIDEELDGWRAGDEVAVLPVAQNVTMEVILRAVLGVADPTMRRRLRELIDDTLGYPFAGLRRRFDGTALTRVTPPRRVRVAGALVAALPTPAVMTYFPELKVRSRWNPGTLRWWRHRDDLLGVLDAQVAATRADPRLAEREDILAMLVQSRDERGEGLGDDDLRDELVALIAAGHETTAAAIAWGAVLLAHDPDVRERAARAARDGDDRYLDALVKEVLRLRPPLPGTAARVLDAPLRIGEHLIPPGTPILVDGFGLHHDPALHPEPEALRPERFLDGAPEAYAWLPFGGGAHRCIGAGLAELEIRVALGTMLRRIELAPAVRELAPAVRRGVTLVPLGGGRIRVAGAA